MNLRRPLIFLGLAILLALLVYVVERPERPRVDDASAAYFVPGFDSDRIDRVEIEQLLDGAELKRDGENWMIAERVTPLRKELLDREGKGLPEAAWHRADHTRVTSALGSFGGLEAGVLVSDNPEKESLYQVDKGGVAVRGFDKSGEKIFDVVIGRNGPDFASNYLRRADETKVFLVHRPLVGAFSPRADDWRDRKLWAIDPGEISKIAVGSAKGSWEMAKSDDGIWKVTAPSASTPDATKAAEVVGRLSHATAAGFADAVDEETAGLASPSITLTIAFAKDKTARLSLGARDEKGRTYARLEGLDTVFLMPKEFVEGIPPEAPK